MGMTYFDKLRSLRNVTEKYKNLDLENFIRMTLKNSGFDENMMSNVYIDEIVNCPNAFGCYKDNNDIVAYFTNDFGQSMERRYSDPAEFMVMFIRTAPLSEKYDSYKKTL